LGIRDLTAPEARKKRAQDLKNLPSEPTVSETDLREILRGFHNQSTFTALKKMAVS
jgi:hypothetical protein